MKHLIFLFIGLIGGATLAILLNFFDNHHEPVPQRIGCADCSLLHYPVEDEKLTIPNKP